MKHTHTKQNHKGMVRRKNALMAYYSNTCKGPRAAMGAADSRVLDLGVVFPPEVEVPIFEEVVVSKRIDLLLLILSSLSS